MRLNLKQIFVNLPFSRNWVKRGWFILLAALLIGGGFIAFLFVDKQDEVQTAEGGDPAPIPGWWYKDYFGGSVCEKEECKSSSDPDSDKLSNFQEYYYHSNPLKSDTNGNGLSDGEDVASNFDPSRPGKVSFEEVASDDNILGESLLMGSDINNLLSESIDPTKVSLPRVDAKDFRISYENTKEAIASYLDQTNRITTKYFSEYENNTNINRLSDDKLEEARRNSINAASELKKITVPSDAVLLHQYYLGLIQLLPEILSVPDEEGLKDETSLQANKWYDSTQAFAVLMAKIDAENKKLNNAYK